MVVAEFSSDGALDLYYCISIAATVQALETDRILGPW
jgi:hypothetical protein